MNIFKIIHFTINQILNVYVALGWTSVPSSVYSCRTLTVPWIFCEFRDRHSVVTEDYLMNELPQHHS